MKIYTKNGDQGLTDLFGGERVSKSDPRVKAYGLVDAANAALGYAACHKKILRTHHQELLTIMSDLFDMGAELATAQKESAQKLLHKQLATNINEDRVLELEKLIDALELELPQLKNFVLPTGTKLSCRFHLARVAVRQAEAAVVDLLHSSTVRSEIIMYLNRLSDLPTLRL